VLPDSLGVLVIVLALVPGWLYLRLRERRRPPSSATGLSQLLQVVAAGLLTTGISVLVLSLVLSLIPHRRLPWLIDLRAWGALGDDYLRHNVRNSVISVAVVLVLASLAALALDRLQRSDSSDRFHPESSVWGQALGNRPNGTVPWVGLKLRDGPLVEGVLHSLSFGHEDQDERDIAITRPIRVTDEDGGSAREVEIDRVVVPGREIQYISVIHGPEADTTGIAAPPHGRPKATTLAQDQQVKTETPSNLPPVRNAVSHPS
jgi:hypothetical protein